MKMMKVGASAVNVTPLAWDENLRVLKLVIKEAQRQGVAVLCLPELCVTGYGCEDAFFAPSLHETALEVLHELAAETKGMAVSVGLPVEYQGGLYNTACLLVNGTVAGFVAKQLLAGDGVHYEPRWFKGWPAGRRATLRQGDKQYPLGDLVFQCGEIRIGFEICEDAWGAERTGSQFAETGVDLILNPSASHFAFGKHKVRERIVLEGSRAFSATYIYSNLLGNEAGRIIYDGDALIAQQGALLASGRRFSFDDFVLTTASVDIDIDRVARMKRSSTPIATDGNNIVDTHFTLPEISKPEPRTTDARTKWETSATVKEEEFARAVSLGLFDYMRKSQSRGFVVSLSGGVDSSSVACLVWLAVTFASKELGMKQMLARLGVGTNLETDDKKSVNEIVSQILTCLYQSTKQSGEVTRDAAKSVSAAIGARFFEFDVEPMVQSYRKLIEEVFLGKKETLSWEKHDLALQNIQARVRGPSAWFVANLQGALLLATSNRSEASVGYATMDGDTCGGLSPLAGIDKSFLRGWLKWLEKTGPDGASPIPALSKVNSQEPTAELRPAQYQQTDEGDLMPYDVLVQIERYFIRDKRSPAELVTFLAADFPNFEAKQLELWVERFFRLWSRNQWKRERYAPSFHLDDENVDPKTWCRYPILSGGFARELRQLQGKKS